MRELENQFLNQCSIYNDYENNDYKGDLIIKAYKEHIFDEDLLAFYIALKQKFDCLYGFLLTKNRIIEISAYTTMYTINIRKYKAVKKVILEKEFDETKIKKFIASEMLPERVQVRFSYLDINNQEDEIVWEGIEKKESITQAIEFAENIFRLQYEM